MPTPCPTQQRLDAFLAGVVDEDTAREICSHLDTCSHCESLTATLERNHDGLLAELQEQCNCRRYLEEPEFRRLRNEISTARSGACETAPTEDSAVAAGTRLRDYRLLKRIGQGGMGTVYLAQHLHLGKAFAVKILPESKLRSEHSVARFRREMLAAGKVNHPNLISASDAGSVDGIHFLVMELVEGADLGRIVRERGPLEVADACEITRQAALGLQHAHDNGILHRDVKPSNLMLTTDGTVKLLDLGLAGSIETTTASGSAVPDGLTHAGDFVGTPDYMAPEQFTSNTPVNERSDLYGLGATLLQLLTGRTPWAAHPKLRSDKAAVNLNELESEINAIRDDVPESLVALIGRLLSTMPQQRPDSAVSVANQLQRFSTQGNLVRLAESCKNNPGMLSADLANFDEISWTQNRQSVVQLDRPDSAKPKTTFIRYVTVAAAIALVVVVVVWWFDDNAPVSQQSQSPKDADQVSVSPAENIVAEADVIHAIRSGDTERAATLAQQLIDRAPDQGWNHALAAMIAAYGSHAEKATARQTYDRQRDWIAKRWDQTGEGTNTIPRICCLFPDPPGDLPAMLAAITAEAKQRPKDWRYPHSEMMVLYRLGRFNDALAAFGQARRVSPSLLLHRAVDTAWSALILEELGRSSEARNALENAKQMQSQISAGSRTTLPHNWFDWIELVVLLDQVDQRLSSELADNVARSQPSQPESSQTRASQENRLHDDASPTLASERTRPSTPGESQVQTQAQNAADPKAKAAWASRVIDRLMGARYAEAESAYEQGQRVYEADWSLRCRVVLGLMISGRDDAQHRLLADRYRSELEQTLQSEADLSLTDRVSILQILALSHDRPWDQAVSETASERIQGERWNDWQRHHCLALVRFRQGRLALALDHQAAAGQQTKSELRQWLHEYWWTMLLASNGQLDLARRSLMKAQMGDRQFTPLLDTESAAKATDVDTVLELRWMMPQLRHRLAPLENLKFWVAGQQPAFVNLDDQIHQITKRLIAFPKSAELYFQRGTVFTRMRRQREAFADFQRAAVLNAEHPVYHALDRYAAAVTENHSLLREYCLELAQGDNQVLQHLDREDPNSAFVFRLLLAHNLSDHVYTVHFGDVQTLAERHSDDWYCQYVLALWNLRMGHVNDAEALLRTLMSDVDDTTLEQYCTLWWVEWLRELQGKQTAGERNESVKRLSLLQSKTQFNPTNVVDHWLAVYESMLLATSKQNPLRQIVESDLLKTQTGPGVSIVFDLARSELPKEWFNINASAISRSGDRCAFTPLRADNLYLLETAGQKLLDFPAGGEVRCLTFASDGSSLIIGRPNKHVDVIEIASRRLAPLDVKFQPNALAAHPDGNQLAVAFQARRIEMWDLVNEQIAYPPTLLLGVPERIAFNPSGSHLAVSMLNDHTTVFSKALEPAAELPHAGTFAWIDDQTLCCFETDSNQLRIVQLDDTDRSKTLATLSGGITAFVYLQSHRLIVSGNDQGDVTGWSLNGKSRTIGRLPRAVIRQLSASDDGRYLLVTGKRHRQSDGGSCCVLLDLQSI
ncbi:WD40 repeat domain-containing serine/threonine protein kinase [Stieleria mannarensis]|uniref:WD40 repeat domain-containing serine/threonine protein kinase n=1 Tax=Stieleria mannarensis TaxID=2755585 RepID=UPI0016020C0B|nr:WD40 repeat domain-containing serine/threonine protein kinase [Rhodopirellula sp. JC639]